VTSSNAVLLATSCTPAYCVVRVGVSPASEPHRDSTPSRGRDQVRTANTVAGARNSGPAFAAANTRRSKPLRRNCLQC